VGHAKPTGYRGRWVWAGMATLGGWASPAMGAAFWVTPNPRDTVVGGHGPEWRHWVQGRNQDFECGGTIFFFFSN
jgi:hypothetical protein